MKKNIFSLGYLAMLFCATVFIAGCSGEDGAPGPAGTNGTNGTNGEDGSGFAEAVAKGNVILILDGKRPDGVAFKDTIDYRFAPTSYDASYFYDYQPEVGQDVRTYLSRYQGFDGITEAGGGYVNAYSEGWWGDDAAKKSAYVELEVNNTIIEFPQEFKYFTLYTDFYISRYLNTESGEFEVETDMTEEAITAYSHDTKTTGKVVYKYSGVVNAEDNSTGYDLKVTVITDATVYQRVEEPEGDGDGRHGSNGRAASAKVAKAEMKSMK